MFEKISVIFVSAESKISNIVGKMGKLIGVLIIKPNMIIIPIMKLINMFEIINVSDIVLNSSILTGSIAIHTDIDTCASFLIF